MKKSANSFLMVLACIIMPLLLFLCFAGVSPVAAKGDAMQNQKGNVATLAAAKAASAKVAQSTATTNDVVSVGFGYLDPEDHSKGGAVVVHTRKGLAKERVNALIAPVKVTVGGQQVEVPVRVEQSGEFFAHAAQGPEGAAENKVALAQRNNADNRGDVATFAAARAASAQFTQRATAAGAGNDVVSVGIGYLDPQDHSKGPAVVVYSRKGLASERAAAHRAPLTVTAGGRQVEVPVRVEESGEFFAHLQARQEESGQARRPADRAAATADPEYVKRIRPLVAGYSVGTTNGSGTAGLIVIKNNTLYILSNDHVLNLNNTAGFSATLQPGAADGGTDPSDRIGRLFQFVMLRASGDSQDSAIAVPTSQSDLNPRYGRGRITVPGHYVNFNVGTNAIKAGRTTGDINDGYADSITQGNTTINYNGFGGLSTGTYGPGLVIFKSRSNVPVSLPGDSGSTWLNKNDKYALAVNFAGPSDGKYSITFPINWAMTTYSIKVAIPSGGTIAAEQKAGQAVKAGDTKTMEAEEAALTQESPTRAEEAAAAE